MSNTGFLGGVVFVLVFGGMILVHELGHFVAARLLKIDVEEFGFGIPPRIAGVVRDSTNKWRFFFGQKVPQLDKQTRSHTIISLNWIPLGGFNRFKGEEDPTAAGGLAAAAPWKRIVMLLSGAAMNLLTAVVAYTFLFSQIGVPQPHTVIISEVSPNSPAEAAGIKADDIVLTAAGEKITDIVQLQTITRAHLDQPISLVIERGGQQIELSVTPLSSRPKEAGAMGVLLGNPWKTPSSWFATIPISFEATYGSIRALLALPGQIIAGVVKPEEAQLAGPRSIWNLFQATVASDMQSREAPAGSTDQQPTNYTLMAIISLTISLGVLNLLPVPALDGGRILFTLPELLTRKRIPPRFEAMVHGAGLMLLVAVLGYFYILDFIRPVAINLP